MRTWENVMSLTLEVWPDETYHLHQLPPKLQELSIVHREKAAEVCIAQIAPLPYLQRLSLWDGCLSSALLLALFSISPCLEQVDLYRRLDYLDCDEVVAMAREALTLLHRRPAVSFHCIDGFGKLLNSTSVVV
jgi:hypothetical protein